MAKPGFRDLITAQPSLVLWIENTASANPGIAPPGSTWLTIADDTGHAAGKRVLYLGRFRARKSTVAFSNWPRSSRKLTIRWFEGMRSQEGKLVGEWIVANPAYQAPAPWVPEPLPLTRSNGSLRCTLERALFGVGRPERITAANELRLNFKLAGAGEEPGAVLVPRLTADSPGEEWEIGSVLLHDVSGNNAWCQSLWLRANEFRCFFTTALWPAGVWEVKIFAKRQVPHFLPLSESFSPEELLVFKDLELTGSGATTWNQTLERSGARVRLTQFTLRPPQDLSEPWKAEDASELRATLSRGSNETVHVAFQLGSLPPRISGSSRTPDGTVHVDLAGVIDDRGNPHYPRAQGYSTTVASSDLALRYSFPSLPLETRKLTIVFVVQRGRDFTFHVQPEIASSPVSLP